ncbi:EamA family transporter [Lysobacteraceae bacterium NML07-0707]|nr:EamA family transporter [Xanthomonadaceae bacterium NML07-0707]
MPHASRINASRAVWLMLAALLAFAVMDAAMKQLSSHYPPLQISALRGFSSLPLVLLWAVSRYGWASLKPVNTGLHLLRAGFGILMLGGFVYGLSQLPLSTAYAIFFVAPLMVTVLAVWVLGEQVGPRRWSAIAIGFVGVLVILRPGVGDFSWAALAVVVAALAYAANVISVQLLSRTDSTPAMVVWFLLLLGLASAGLALPSWVAIDSMKDIGVMALMGLFGALGQVAVTEAFRLGEASKIAPLEYSALLWTVLIDLMVWRTLPDAITWVGAGIIVASGLYLLRREPRVKAIPERP